MAFGNLSAMRPATTELMEYMAEPPRKTKPTEVASLIPKFRKYKANVGAGSE